MHLQIEASLKLRNTQAVNTMKPELTLSRTACGFAALPKRCCIILVRVGFPQSHIYSPIGATEGNAGFPSFAPGGALFTVDILPHPHGMGLQLLRP